MRSPHIIANLSPSPQKRFDEAQEGQDDDSSCAGSSKRLSYIPQPRASASLSSFASPTWGDAGEKTSNIRVVTRIRPFFPDEQGGEHNKQVIVALDNTDENRDGNDEASSDHLIMSSMIKSPNSSALSEVSNTNSSVVADIAAKFNTYPSSPLIPNIITTPTKFHSSPYDGKTPIHTNVDNNLHYANAKQKSKIIPPSSLRQSFLQAPKSPFSCKSSNSRFSHSTTKKKQQSIAAGLDLQNHFDFDAVLDTTATQQDVYNASIGDAIRRNIFRGFNTTVLSYGHGNSGKTHTMYGNIKDYNKKGTYSPKNAGGSSCSLYSFDDTSTYNSVLNDDDGIVFRAVQDLFIAKNRQATGGEVLINMNFIELYNDRVFDLLSNRTMRNCSSSQSMSKEGGFSVSSGRGLNSIRIKSVPHARQVIDRAFKRKHQGGSHNICTFQVTINPAVNRTITSGKLASITNTDVISAKLTLVDLAGPNRTNESLKSVNRDLFVLGQVITALAGKSEKKEKFKHIPFRDSKLTAILRESLGGNCCTVMVACVSPYEKELDDSLNTLRYAESTRNITNRVKKNIKTKALTPAEGAALRRENKVLKSQLLEMTRKYQFLKRTKRGMDSTYTDSDSICSSVVEFNDTIMFSPSSRNLRSVPSTDTLDSQRWRMKFERLAALCTEAGLSTRRAELSSRDEALLVSHEVEVVELREQIQQLLSCQLCEDGASVTSGLTMETEYSWEDHSTVSGTSTMLSLASKSINSKLSEVERDSILRSSMLKLKLEREESSYKQKMNELKDLQDSLNTDLVDLNDKKNTIIRDIAYLEDEHCKKEGSFNEQIKEQETLLGIIEKTVESLEQNKIKLENDISSLKEELGLQYDTIKERQNLKQRVEVEVNNLKSQIKLLNEEKLTLFDEVEDLQNTKSSLDEDVEEQNDRKKCKERLQHATKVVESLTIERDLLRERLDVEKELTKKEVEKRKVSEKHLETLTNEVSTVESNTKASTKRSVLQDRSNEVGFSHKPPLPSPHQMRICSSPSIRSTEKSVVSYISVSKMLEGYDVPKSDDTSTVLFGDIDEFGFPCAEQDHDTVRSCMSDGCSLTSDQRAVREHAKRLLFWADKAITRKNNERGLNISMNASMDSDLDFESDRQDKENFISGSPIPKHRGRDMSSRSIRSRLTQSRSPSPHSQIIRHTNSCSCMGSMFSGNKEHAEFFLPKLGMACNCGAEEAAQARNNNPTSLKSFLRSWQVSYLKSVGITTAKALINGERKNATNLSKAMKKWRYTKRMKPAHTKSCVVALQIWSKVAKTVLKSEEKRKEQEKEQKEEILFCGLEDKKPMFLEIGLNTTEDDDQTFASISTLGHNASTEWDSFTLMEGEFEI